MSIHVAIRHNTYYKYEKLISVSPQIIRLKPAPHSRTPILAYSLKITPSNHFINWQQDPFGNYMARVVFPDKIKEFFVEVEVIADMVTINPFDFFLEEYAERIPFSYEPLLKKELTPYLEIIESGPQLKSLYERSRAFLNDQSINFLVSLNQLVYHEVGYTIRLEEGIQSCEETLTKGTGSCRDSAWLLVHLLRMHGLAARFVSGYLVQLKADQESVDGPSGTEQDFTDLHAWAEVYLPGAGWIGLDATSGLLAGEGHIPLSCTPNPSSAAPISGLAEPCQVDFSFENIVERIYESPRVTKPHSEEDWSHIIDLGKQVDQMLLEGDVRLTMGGEPTFVSAEDMESAQWNTEADGQEKRKKAYDLTLRLRDEFAPEGIIHQGQGKWYPGEAIPRWQYVLYWRKDGQKLWKDQRYLDAPDSERSYTIPQARQIMHGLSRALGINPENIREAYEDVYYFLWEKSKLPVNKNPLQPDKTSSLEQKKLAELLQSGLDQPVGLVLPLSYDVTLDRWTSCYWEVAREKLFLIPGNSALGYRLPLDSLPAVSPKEMPVVIEPSPLDDLGPMRDMSSVQREQNNDRDDSDTIKTIRTALSIEIREGRMYVFLPPLVAFDHFAELIYLIGNIVSEQKIHVIIEGYQPPYDNRVEKLAVTPDPGVLEINVPPAKTWDEVVFNYEHIFEQARQCKLGAEKFMIDGRHTGTGGGNHITLGGITPADSPLLRRPDLLRSMVNFWQNHPSLSYLFSSAFVGPTSQAPRVDEGRRGTLQELEIAFAELERHKNPSPWIVDRIFRNLLIDLTGNTHRAEFCIDKLYSPDSNTGRLGILEMRGFDMPPNLQMCLIQILLIRSLVARFWKTPYKYPLIDWGNDLHDKFLLHTYVKEDMKEVINYLQEGGINFKLSWLESFFEFRFPLLGETMVRDMKITLRSAIEPWNVLGEEMSNTGTARFVDSSVEKIEVLVSGLHTERYQLLCNQVMVPLSPTEKEDTFVAGIRYKAWNPPSSLHPTIGVDTPLTFDIYDSWNQRSIGGCTYHVAHPGGRNYETFPVNSLEAEGRRVTRFFDENHTPKAIIQTSLQENEFLQSKRTVEKRILDEASSVFSVIKPPLGVSKYTLDLRRVR